MAHCVVSSRYQVTIPKEVRECVGLRPGQRLAVIVRGSVISLVPEVPLAELRGMARGMDTSGLREKTDRM